ncbi:E3 ubiquitin-protein ligase kcmf1 [Ilyodon furcidens]
MFHPGRGLGGPRARRTNMHFTSGSTGGLSSSSSQSSTYTPSNRETMDPIAELLSQLSGVRRATGGQINSSGPSASQLQQLQMQLQLERQQAQAARQQVEAGRHATRRGNNPNNAGNSVPPPSSSTANTNTVGESNPSSSSQSSQFLLARLNEPKMSEAERQFLEGERADRSLFVQELLLSTLMHEESSSSDEDERRDFADFGAMGCVDIMPLDVALENLQLRESSSSGREPPPPPL